MTVEIAKRLREHQISLHHGGCGDCYAETMERAADEVERLSTERDELYGYVNGLLGLLQLVSGRDDMPAEIADVLNTNHRAVDAAAYLTQITPTLKTQERAP